jgi:hypothetical protein
MEQFSMSIDKEEDSKEKLNQQLHREYWEINKIGIASTMPTEQ